MASLINNAVNLGGNQTISGAKTISYGDGLYIKSPTTDTSTPPTADNLYSGITIYDKNGVRFGKFEGIYTTADYAGVQLSASRLIDGVLKYTSGLGLTMDNAGNAKTFCPPSDLINSIVTTVAIRKTGNGYVKFGNGLQIAWGSVQSGSTATFSHPFSNIYSVVLTQHHGANVGYSAYIWSYSTTQVRAQCYNNDTGRGCSYIAIGLGA